jgi:hypothetical protein
MNLIDARFIHSARVKTGEAATATKDAYGKTGSTPVYTLIACLFGRSKGGTKRLESGDLVESLPTMSYPATYTLSEGQEVEGLSPGYARTYVIRKIHPVYTRVLDHFRADIERTGSP